jgi:hypothetical protein
LAGRQWYRASQHENLALQGVVLFQTFVAGLLINLPMHRRNFRLKAVC